MGDNRLFDVVLARLKGKRNAYCTKMSGDILSEWASDGTLKPNDLVRWHGDEFFFYAHQINLFPPERLQGVVLKNDNLPRHLRDKWVPEPHPEEPGYRDRHGNFIPG